MIEKLQLLNNRLMEANDNNEAESKKCRLIKKILSDDKCFFKMKIEYAYSILRDLGIQENNLKKVYMELIDVKNT